MLNLRLRKRTAAPEPVKLRKSLEEERL
jgi:hypothetical protein